MNLTVLGNKDLRLMENTDRTGFESNRKLRFSHANFKVSSHANKSSCYNRSAEYILLHLSEQGCEKLLRKLQKNPPNNNTIVGINIKLSKARYRCRNGFKLVGLKIRSCKNGKWKEKQEPRCLGIVHWQSNRASIIIHTDSYLQVGIHPNNVIVKNSTTQPSFRVHSLSFVSLKMSQRYNST